MKKQLAITALAVTIAGTGLFAGNRVFAQTTSPDRGVSLVQKIAERFGLNANDVQAVFDEERSARQAEMQAAYEQRLAQFVSDGSITEAQKQLILAKHKELAAQKQTLMQTMQGKTKEEIRTAMETRRTELENWAKQNNIDIKYLMGGVKLHAGGEGKLMFGRGGMGTPPANTLQ